MKKLPFTESTKRLVITLLILLISFVSNGAAPQAHIRISAKNTQANEDTIFRSWAAQQGTDLNDEEKVRATIESYFTTRYEGQKKIKEQDFSFLLEDVTSDWVKKEKEKREIELYLASLFDLGYQNYKFNLNYDSIEIIGDQAIVGLRESHQVAFNAIAPEVSIMANLKHTLTLHKIKDAWLISKDEYRDELSKQLDYKTKDEIKEQIDANYQKEKEGPKQDPSIDTNVLEMPRGGHPSLSNYTYDRTEAVRYADAHMLPTELCPLCDYNTAYYRTEGADCTNFVSQAIYAGGGKSPPDTSGMTNAINRSYSTDWYYVFNSPAYIQNGSGSIPWVRVQAQRDFIVSNTNKIGPYGYETTRSHLKNGYVGR